MAYTTSTRRLAAAAAGAAALAVLAAACGKDPTSVPDLNNLPADVVAGNLSANTAQLLTTGLANRDRDVAGFRYIIFAETLARDVYNIDPSESRFQTELLGNAIDPAGFTGGSGGFTEAFNAIATADLITTKINTAADLSAAQQSAIKGFAYTMKALDLYRALEIRGTNGLPIEPRPATASGAALAPIKCEPTVLAAVSAILDSGATALQAGGTAFPSSVTLPAGFSSNGAYNTPAGLLKFNRGLKGRAEFYRGLRGGGTAAFTNAVAALSAFADPAAPLTNGVYQTFGAAPDIFNPIAVATVYLNPTVTTPGTGAGAFGQSQVLQPGDARASKVTVSSTTTTRNGVSTNLRSSLATASSTNLTRPLPIFRNAEAILLRAQAEIELGQFAAATADINVVRTGEGGLAPIPTIASRDEGIRRVLYEKRFSLLLEGAQRLVDLRTYGLLNAANLGASQRGSADAFLTQLPIPQTEIDARTVNGTSNLTCSN